MNNTEDFKKIYIVLTYTGTMLSKVIKYYTKDQFAHVSIALDKELNEMYSFGRLNAYNPFWGGFVHEYIDKGTFKRFYNTKSKIYSMEVTDEQYNNAKCIIKQIESLKAYYDFNTIGLFAVGFNKKIQKYHSFYCAEFVKYVLEKSNILQGLPEKIRPKDFDNLKNSTEIYSGFLREYSCSNIKLDENIMEKL